MLVAGALGMLALVVPLLVAVPAYAQQDAARQQFALSVLSDELAACDAYCQIISRCLGGPKSAQDPANLSLSQQYADRAKTSRREARQRSGRRVG